MPKRLVHDFIWSYYLTNNLSYHYTKLKVTLENTHIKLNMGCFYLLMLFPELFSFASFIVNYSGTNY